MTDEQGANEIKYRVASLLLLSLLHRMVRFPALQVLTDSI